MNKKLTKKETEELKHHTRRLSIKEGMVWSVRNAFGDNYLAPFAIAINLTSPIVAVVNSLWNLTAISQLFGPKLMKKFKRKTIISYSVLLQTLCFLALIGIALLYLNNIFISSLPYLMIITLIFMMFFIGIGNPPWFSLMGDVVDSKFRGRWFSKRNTIISFTTITLAMISAILLDFFKNNQMEIEGFIIFFIIALLTRITAAKLFKHHFDPKENLKQIKKEKPQKFNKNFKEYILFRGLFAFALSLTTPLVSIYLLRYLGFDYIPYIVIILSGTLFSVFTLNFWGKLADKYGNYRIIAITTMIIPLTPILWMLSTSKIYLFLVPAILGGTSWTAFMMASGNFIYDNVKKDRARAISYMSLSLGIGAFAGGLVSALLIKMIHTTWIEPITLIFIIGAVARMIIVCAFIPKIREIKRKEKIKNLKSLQHQIIKDIKPTLIEDFHEITSITGYIKEK